MISEPSIQRQSSRSAEEPSECPACAAAEDAARALLAGLTGDASSADRFNWLGVCNAHARWLLHSPELAQRLAAARLRRNLQRLEELNAPAVPSGRFGRRRPAPPFAGEGDCPFDAAMASAAEEMLKQLVDEQDVNAALCLPHVCAALDLAHGRDRLRSVGRAARRQFTLLEQDLSELIRKSDYRFRGEPRGREATAWTRAARLAAGAPAVRWSLRREPTLEG